MYFLEHHCSNQEDYTVEADNSLYSRNDSQPACLSITALLPVKGRIIGSCHA